MRKLNETLIKAQCKMKARTNSSDAVATKRKYARVASVVVMIVSIMMACACTAFAAGSSDAIATGIANGMDSFYGLMRMVAIPVAGVAVAFAAFQFFTGGEKGMQKAGKVILYAAIGIGVVLAAPLIVKTIAGWFSSIDHSVDVFNG